MTGYTGFLGRYVLQSSASHNIRIFPLEADFKSALIYPDLINISSGSIIHCGATSNRNSVDKDLFKKNVTATSQIASLIRDRPDVNLIFTSANSLGSDSDSSCIRSLYCFSKFLAELEIQKYVPESRFSILRLPGLYAPGFVGKGILDKLFYTKSSVFPESRQTLFGNVALASDVADFLIKLATLPSQCGYIGNIQAVDKLPLGIISDALKFSDVTNLDPIVDTNSILQSKAMSELAFPRRSVVELLKLLYFNETSL